MWVDSGIGDPVTLVRQDVLDRPERQHDEAECRVGRVEAVGAVDDETDAPVQAFVAGIVHAKSNGGQDARTPLADGLGRGDERFEATALCLRAEPVEEDADLLLGQVAGEDGPKGLLQRVGPPQVPASALQLAQRRGLVIGQVGGVLEQRPPGTFEAAGGILVGQLSQVLPDLPADLLEGGRDRLHDMKGS